MISVISRYREIEKARVAQTQPPDHFRVHLYHAETLVTKGNIVTEFPNPFVRRSKRFS